MKSDKFPFSLHNSNLFADAVDYHPAIFVCSGFRTKPGLHIGVPEFKHFSTMGDGETGDILTTIAAGSKPEDLVIFARAREKSRTDWHTVSEELPEIAQGKDYSDSLLFCVDGKEYFGQYASDGMFCLYEPTSHLAFARGIEKPGMRHIYEKNPPPMAEKWRYLR